MRARLAEFGLEILDKIENIENWHETLKMRGFHECLEARMICCTDIRLIPIFCFTTM